MKNILIPFIIILLSGCVAYAGPPRIHAEVGLVPPPAIIVEPAYEPLYIAPYWGGYRYEHPHPHGRWHEH